MQSYDTELCTLKEIVNQDNIDFSTSITNYKTVYYHFLDSLINSNIGDTLPNVLQFIKTYKLIKNEIFILEENTGSYNSFKYTNMINEDIGDIYNNEKLDLTTIRNVFKYCIYRVGNNKHATSIVILEYDNKLYLLSFNSGKGIEIHSYNKDNKDNKLYQPYKGFIVCDYIYDDTKYIQAIHHIFTILNIDKVYKYLEDTNKYTINEFSRGVLSYNFTDILKTLNNFEQVLCIKLDYLKLLKDKNNYIYTKKYITDNTSIDKPCIISDYYDFFFSIIDIFITTHELKYTKIQPSYMFNDITFDRYKDDEVKLDDSVIYKQIFHFIDDNIYIKDQDSGSCTWFSIYWPLIFYHVINHDIKSYICQIKYINYVCYKIVNKIFTPYNFKTEYISQASKYIQMKKLCNKFVDIKMLDSTILNEQMDIMYKTHIIISKKDLKK